MIHTYIHTYKHAYRDEVWGVLSNIREFDHILKAESDSVIEDDLKAVNQRIQEQVCVCGRVCMYVRLSVCMYDDLKAVHQRIQEQVGMCVCICLSVCLSVCMYV
jgi:hypothetical protein